MAIAPRWPRARGLKSSAMTPSEVGALWGHFGLKGHVWTLGGRHGSHHGIYGRP
jgi:hypothetical protein